MKFIKQYKIISLFILILISGCSSIEQRVKEELWKHSGVPEDISYIQYQQMNSADALNKDGMYHSQILEQYKSTVVPEGTVYVSFARNEFLKINYYQDKELTKKIETDGCWMNPGDSIYASAPEVTNQANLLYRFSELNVLEIGPNRNVIKLLATANTLPGEVYHIPEDFQGSDISIIPLGKYLNRVIDLKAVYKHPDGSESILENGVWYINGIPHGNGTAELNPMSTCRIVYDYSAYKNDWYYVGSVPESYWERSSDSTITFIAEPSDISNEKYEVQLHPFLSMTIKNAVSYQNVVDSLLDGAANIFSNKSIIETQNIIELIQVNGITQINNFSDTEVTLPELKVGDEILLRLPGDLKANSEGLVLPDAVENDGNRDYRFVIPDSEQFDIQMSVSRRHSDPERKFHEVSIENGTLSLFDSSGIRYNEGSELPAENERVNVQIVPAADYCVYGKNVKNNVYQADMKYDEFEKNISSIISEHPIRKGIFVTIDTSDDLGTCVFWTGTDMIEGTVMLREDQDLQFDYLLNTDSGYEIILTPEEIRQIVNVWSPYAASRNLEVSESMQGMTLRCRDFVTLQERTVADDITDFN